MGAKREQVLWESVWSIAERLEEAFSLKAIASAGVVLFDQLSGDEQKQAIVKAKYPTSRHFKLVSSYRINGLKVTDQRDFKKQLKALNEKAQADPNLPDPEKKALDDYFQLLLSFAQYRKVPRKKTPSKSA
jgi:hypothetical protein